MWNLRASADALAVLDKMVELQRRLGDDVAVAENWPPGSPPDLPDLPELPPLPEPDRDWWDYDPYTWDNLKGRLLQDSQCLANDGGRCSCDPLRWGQTPEDRDRRCATIDPRKPYYSHCECDDGDCILRCTASRQDSRSMADSARQVQAG